jgi:predicted transcriptional regulator YdeE
MNNFLTGARIRDSGRCTNWQNNAIIIFFYYTRRKKGQYEERYYVSIIKMDGIRVIIMEPVIINQRKSFTLFGFSKTHDKNKAYSETIFELLDKVWEEVRNNGLSHTGINHIVYESGHIMFAGIELVSPPNEDSLLEKKDVILEKYAYCKHIGPYRELDKTYESIQSTVKALGEHHELPLLEVYGHWKEDESKLETEIFYNLK